jgi:hypothetical protein
MGLTAIFAGLVIGITALGLGVQGWEIGRLWFYMVGSAMIFLIGVSLIVYWLLLRILEELSQREALTTQDIGSGEL